MEMINLGGSEEFLSKTRIQTPQEKVYVLLPTYAKFLCVALGHHCSTVTGQVENISPGCREAEAWEPTAGVPARLPRNLPTGSH